MTVKELMKRLTEICKNTDSDYGGDEDSEILVKGDPFIDSEGRIRSDYLPLKCLGFSYSGKLLFSGEN